MNFRLVALAVLGNPYVIRGSSHAERSSLESLFKEIDSLTLFDAVDQGNSQIVEHLTETGVNINLEDLSGRTPLLVAAEGGHMLFESLDN